MTHVGIGVGIGGGRKPPHLGEVYEVQRRTGVVVDGLLGPATLGAIGDGIALLFEDRCTFYLGDCGAPVVSRSVLAYRGSRILCSRCEAHSRNGDLDPWGPTPLSESEVQVLRVMES